MAYPFKVGESYRRQDVYELLNVPEEQRRGNWETGYNQWGGDLYIFCNVGAAGRSGHDYDNRWLDEERFQWFAKERTHVGQRQIQWMLNPTGNILHFTRSDNRLPFVFNGFATPVEHEATTPVRIVWRVSVEPTAIEPTNYVLANRREIVRRHYVRVAKRRYWFGFDRSRVDAYKASFGTKFALVLVGDENIAGDYYFIPYEAIAHLLADEFATEHASGRVRWIGDVRQHRLKISTCPTKLDVGQFYGIPVVEDTVGLPEAVENDYAIENRVAEIKQRVKQSVFRQRVLENFGGRCCLCGLAEPDLLVAGHIVPWAARIDCRLDPANGLCLSVLYDALFDAGYFTIADDMRVVVAKDTGFSEPLRSALASIAGVQIHPPRIPLNADFLAFHRQQVFRG